jgi:simple sugar transport system ATP-binding protein
MIELQHITKRFGTLTALEDVTLRIEPGSILGLLGENGAGKSTLMNVLFGLQRPDSGAIVAGGKAVAIGSPKAAQRLGIGMVHQHFKLVPTLTVLENLRLFIAQKPALLRERAVALLAQLHWAVPLDEAIEDLPVGTQQRIEIVKALLMIAGTTGGRAGGAEHGTLILDEPTAVLTPQETGELFTALRTLRDGAGGGGSGGTAIVFISHKLAEVAQVCDHVAILRRGKLVHAGLARDLSPDDMARIMVGTHVEHPRLQRADSPTALSAMPRPEILALRNVSTEMLRDVSLALHAGEIVGIAGVDGNGQSHLVQSILGTRKLAAGEVRIQDAPAGPLRARLEKVAFIAEDRQREALVMPLSIEENLLLKDYRTPRFSTLGWLRLRAWRTQSRALMEQFDVRAPGPLAAVARLSGGNQQKVVLARELGATPAEAKPIVVAVNPTRGLDVGATAFVFQKLLEARRAGAAVLLIHSDLDELLSLSDRVAVLYNGRLTPAEGQPPSREAVGRMMLGLPPLPPPAPHPVPPSTHVPADGGRAS